MKNTIRMIALVLAVMMVAIPAMAAGSASAEQNGTPSVEQNGAPSAQQNGAPSAQQTGSPSAEQNGPKSGDNEIIITTLMDKDADKAILDSLDAAQKQLEANKDLSAVAPKLAEVMKAAGCEAAVDTAAVRDLFHIAVIGKTAAAFEANKKIDVTFNVELEAGQHLMVMVQNGEQWDVIPAESVKVESGKATVTFTQLGVVAFVVA